MVKIPKVFSRLGHTGQAYYISQWFPKPAVYDQKGWHPISYMDQGEFYSEYGSYDVTITVPKNYVLMATGNCVDEQESKVLEDLAAMPMPADTVYSKSTPESSTELKTVHYHEDHIHDFAWFADKRWVVRKDTVLSPGTNSLVTVWSAFVPAYQKVWKNSNDYLKETVKYYGKWVGPYQYKTIKAVSGDLHAGSGMEYPTITIIDKSSTGIFKTAVVHEAGHNWFYGMLGSNEREHAWMDEGINTFYEQKTTHILNHDSGKEVRNSLNENLLYYQNAATGEDQAIDQVATNFEKLNYGLDVYYKSGLVLNWLEQYIGKADFEKGMHDYYDTWHFHHPYPEDFRACMERHTTKPLGWFFDTVLNTDKLIDFKIAKAKINGNTTDITVKNRTGVTAPLYVAAYKNDSVVGGGWTVPFAHSAMLSLPVTDWTTLKVGEYVPDGKPTNDVYKRHALFHRFRPQVKPYLGLNMTDKDKLFIAPAPGYNQYDGFMFGLMFHNLTLPENHFRFALVPMYAFGAKDPVGAGSIGYAWYPHGLFKEVLVQVDGKTFHNNETLINLKDPLYANYVKIAPSLNFVFNEHNALSPVTRSLTLKGYSITENDINLSSDSLGKPVLKGRQNIYGLIRYQHKNTRTFNPFDYQLEGQMGEAFAKVSVEGNLRIDYDVKGKSLYVRGYAGKFFAIDNNPATTYRYLLNSSFSALDDYLYDGSYRGRNAVNGLSSRQLSIQEGGFKVPVMNNVGRSDDWLATINLKTDLPLGKLPLRLFFDAGLTPNFNQTPRNTSSTTLQYDGGIEIYLVKDIVSAYIPLVMSSDFQNYLSNTYGRSHVFERSISFNVQLQNINWLKAPMKLLKIVTTQ